MEQPALFLNSSITYYDSNEQCNLFIYLFFSNQNRCLNLKEEKQIKEEEQVQYYNEVLLFTITGTFLNYMQRSFLTVQGANERNYRDSFSVSFLLKSYIFRNFFFFFPQALWYLFEDTGFAEVICFGVAPKRNMVHRVALHHSV